MLDWLGKRAGLEQPMAKAEALREAKDWLRGVTGAEADLVRKTFHVKKGEPVVRSQLLGSLCDVYQLSTVEDVDWAPRFDKAAARVDIVLDVTPANTAPGAVTLKKEKGRYPQTSRKTDPKALSEL